MGHCATKRCSKWGAGPGRSLDRFPRLNWTMIVKTRKRRARKIAQATAKTSNVELSGKPTVNKDRGGIGALAHMIVHYFKRKG